MAWITPRLIKRAATLILGGVAALSLAACGSVQPRYRAASMGSTLGTRSPCAAPADARGTMKPYQVAGRWYCPRVQPRYDEVGTASWYGYQHQGRSTADGEVFDQTRLSAAHKTLPLPSLVEVTNLDNGRRVQVRVNDRGPFVDGRLIDLSRGAADQLGFLGKGTARVRVRYLKPADRGGSAVAAQPTSSIWAGSAPAPRPSVPAPIRTRPVETAPPQAYLVQAGAFSEQDNARQALARLPARQGRLEEADLGGRTLYRIVLGPWTDANQAEVARAQVVAYGFADAMIVPAS